jgi:hypothetical protein
MRNKYKIDKDIFKKVDFPWKAYFLGWLYSDGCMSKSGYRVRLTLAEQDRNILDTFSRLLYPEGRPLRYIAAKKFYCKKRQKTYSRTGQYVFDINSKEVCSDLINLGVVPAKSFIVDFPSSKKVPDYLISFFVRGSFEGDGCITFRKCDGRPQISILGSENYIHKLSKWLDNKGIVNTYCRKGNIFSLKVHKLSSINKFTDLVYNGSLELCLSRKFEKLKKCGQLKFVSRPDVPTSKYTGVDYLKRINRWTARATINKKRYHIGCYLDEESAKLARIKFIKNHT